MQRLHDLFFLVIKRLIMTSFKIVIGLFSCISTLLFACNKQSAETNNLLTDSLVINVSNSASISVNNQKITVYLDSIVQDSRCPKDVVCVWAGVAECKLKVLLNNQSYTFKLGTLINGIYKKDTTINGYKFTLDSITPYPSITSPHFYSEYKAYIKVN
ncbi:MAG: hypothetical protein JST29_07125 [Bacteroidetes bacterium]|nr:hypothetical protein [Bacteroidota bacterium]MBS1592610.1 hypothetical protein [Bacteroidota bacterium]